MTKTDLDLAEAARALFGSRHVDAVVVIRCTDIEYLTCTIGVVDDEMAEAVRAAADALHARCSGAVAAPVAVASA